LGTGTWSMVAGIKRNILDIIAPILTGIGAVLGYLLPWYIVDIVGRTPNSIFLFLLIPILAYALCTCTHRKNLLFSKVALMSSLSSIFAFIIGGLVAMPFIVVGSQPLVDGIVSFFIFIIPYLVCRHQCNQEQKRNPKSGEYL
jgi:hypothetical protein